MLEIKNLHVSIEEKKIIKGLDLSINKGEVHALMGPNGSGKSTLSYVLSGKDKYEINDGTIDYNGKNLLELDVDERANEGLFLAFQYPMEIPGVQTSFFLKTAINSKRKYLGQSEMDAGGYKVQGKTLDLARQLFEDALLLQELGCFSMVLEGVPTVVAQSISENINIPTIGIGAGNLTDGQVLVLHDLLGMKSKEYIDAKFVKRYDQQYEATLKALKTYKDEIEKRDFPTDDYSYDMGNDINDSLKEWKKEIKKILS